MSNMLTSVVCHDHLEEIFDLEKVTCVLDNFCRLHSVLKEQVKKTPDHLPLQNVKGLSLLNPAIASEHSNLIKSMSNDFSEAETSWLVKHPKVKERRYAVWHWLSLAETAMEHQYSAQLDGDSVQQFCSFEGYAKLIDAELKQLGFPEKKIILRDFESIAFVGAGALPLSAIMIHQKTGLPVTCIDCDKNAVVLGDAFIEKCGLSQDISYRHIRGDKVDYCIHPYIFIAGLVQDRESVICQVGMSCSGNTIAVRSSMGVGVLLDKPLSSQMTELLYIYFDRHTSAQPPFFNTTWFSSWPFQRYMVDSTVDQIIKPSELSCEEVLQMPKTGRQNILGYNL